MDKEKRSNLIIAGVTTCVIFVVACICFDFTYYLNDDCMLESILSGRFSGAPSAMTFYMSVVLGTVFKLFYSLVPGFSWLGAFHVLLILVCIFLILYRILSFTNNKSAMLIVSVAGIFAMLFAHLVMPHYTITAAISCATGIFWLVTADKAEDAKKTMVSLIPAAVFLLLGYLIRSNVFYMSLVFFGMAAIYRLLNEGIAAIKNYVSIICIFVIIFLAFFFADKMAYEKENYRQYADINRIRTDLYDYSYVGTEPEDLARYAEAGLDESTVMLFKNYNIMLDGEDCLRDMNKLLEYSPAASAKKGLSDVIYLYKEKLIKLSSTSVDSDFPLNYVVIALYVMIMIIALAGKDIKTFIFAIALSVVRSGLWMYLIYMGRYPERIAISLYLLEMAILLGIMLNLGKGKELKLSNPGLMLTAILLLYTAYTSMQGLSERYQEQIAVNGEDGVVYSYMDEKAGFYLLDTYSTVYRTSQVIDMHGSFENYMILGGWMTGHPLVKDKLTSLGFEDVSSALLSDDVYYVTKDGVGSAAEDIAAFLECEYRLVSVLDNRFYIYKFY